MTQGLLDEINHLSLRAFRFWKAASGSGEERKVHRPIKAPGPHLRNYVGLGKHGGKVKHHARKSTFASLQLTPMIDMFIVVLIFLLMTFQASGEILFISKSIVLPNAMNWKELERAPVIGVAADVYHYGWVRPPSLMQRIWNWSKREPALASRLRDSHVMIDS